MTLFFYPWHKNSKSVEALREALGDDARIILTRGSSFRGTKNKKVINWGSSQLPPEVAEATIYNKPGAIAKAGNKLDFFKLIKDSNEPARVPDWTTDLGTAIKWASKGEVVGRLALTSSGGTDIVFSSDGIEGNFIKAKLFTRYIKKSAEFRVHIAFGEVIDVQKKVLRTTDDAGNAIDPKTVDFRIRNHRNGFIFQRNNIEVPDDVVFQARRAMGATSLDFGAVDVIWNEHEKQAYVLEINTAPGLEGTTVESYARKFRELNV
jgi:glutathione synthase/RimK-type ligase-like ATP-grasp enzyme